jgi:PAS domain-containing protein
MVDAANATDMLKGYEILATTRSGSQLTLLQSMRGTQFDNQDVWLFALHDITDRKKAEEQVREREALLSLTLSAANLGLWDWNLHTGLITGDQRWRTMRGLPPDAPGAPWTDDLEPEDVLQRHHRSHAPRAPNRAPRSTPPSAFGARTKKTAGCVPWARSCALTTAAAHAHAGGLH